MDFHDYVYIYILMDWDFHGIEWDFNGILMVYTFMGWKWASMDNHQMVFVFLRFKLTSEHVIDYMMILH